MSNAHKYPAHKYPETSTSPNIPAIEGKILNFWGENKTFQKSVDGLSKEGLSKNNLSKEGQFSFFDGPPFANGLPHYGHLLTSCVKDLFARYQTMNGKRTERVFGWDCHGLPAEMEAEKELGIQGQIAIQEYGIEKFNAECRTSVMKYTGEWQQYINRMGRWVDFENGYKTMDKNYMESVIWAFAELHKKGLVYEGHKVMPYSWACETPLSNFETRLDNAYREKTSKSAYVAFELVDRVESLELSDKKVFVVAWTTTPWTLPSNLALAVGESVEYIAVEKDGNAYIFAKNALSKLAKDLGVDEKEAHFSTLNSQLLIGLRYKPLLPYFADDERAGKNAFTILNGDFVSDADGTGIVHLAPGFGEDDQRVCAENGICLPENGGIICPVDQSGKFTNEIFDILSNFTAEIPPPASGGRLGGGFLGSGRFTSRKPESIEKAKELRKNQTEVEKKLWAALGKDQLEGYGFRRQHPVGSYIVDFACVEKKLIVELDGGQHAENIAYDDARTKFLSEAGYTVLRFWNFEINENFDEVLQTIIGYLNNVENTPHLTSPRKQGEGYSEHKILLSLKNLNVMQDKNKAADEPYSEAQMQKYGLANLRIIAYLKEAGNLIKQEDYVHNYPHCWRTDTPLIYKAVPSWYVKVTAFKDRMVELNQKINWIPGHIKDGMFGKWLENAHDWAISRNRFWGSPIPVWKTESGKIKVFGSVAELEAFFNTKVDDLHRPFIDDLTAPDPENPSENYTRVKEVFDCWFESGSMPFAEVHYPFENQDKFKARFPADFIVEYTAQTRGWFYTLMVLSTALFDDIPFKNCICHGVILGEPIKNPETGKLEKQKLSKRLRNYPDPMEVYNTIGADAMRWLLVSGPIMTGGELTIGKDGEDIKEVVRLVIKPLWNAYHFFTLYANTDNFIAKEVTSSNNLLDTYILAKLKAATSGMKYALDNYDTPNACREVTNFFEVLNNWYIRRSRDRFWTGNIVEAGGNTDKESAYNTLYTCLVNITKAAAPLLPMVTEEIFKNLTGLESVHLQNYPNLENIADEEALLNSMDKVREICTAGLSIRAAENIRTRQPLSKATIYFAKLDDIKNFADIIADELNVKQIEFSTELAGKAELKLKINFPELGKRLPEKMKQIIPAAKQNQWKANGNQVEIIGEVLQAQEFELTLEAKDKQGSAPLNSNDGLVILDLNITDELKNEGIARDVVRAVQQARKDANLNIADRILLTIDAPEKLKGAIIANQNYISEQTLAKNINIGNTVGNQFKSVCTIEEVELALSFEVAA
jgi:isoleucyl-tRNA synthetase/very-short-patch-repair endonuclease